MELYAISASGMERVPPVIAISGVRLRREYESKGKFKIDAVTYDRRDNETKQLADSLAAFLRLPILDEPAGVETTLHVGRRDSSLQVAVTSPPGRTEVGPCLRIAHLAWMGVG